MSENRKKKYSVLIIEDHPLIAKAYKIAFAQITESHENFQFEIDLAQNCDDAIEKIVLASENEPYDIIFLDISLPPSQDGLFASGEDLGIRINEVLPDSKIIIATSFNDHLKVNSLLKSIDPDGFLVKTDIESNELIGAILGVINLPPFYSKSVLNSIRKHFATGVFLDKTDRQLLYELSIGTRMTDLPSVLMMSLRGLHKRKEQLKVIFDIKDCGDRDLIIRAKESGFI